MAPVATEVNVHQAKTQLSRLLTRPTRLPPLVLEALEDRAADLLISSASVWEAAIKVRLGKLPLPQPLSLYPAASTGELAMQVLDVKPSHALALAELPLHHRDPFDRMLVAQARLEKLRRVTADPALFAHDVDLLWAGPGRPPAARAGTGRIGERRRPRWQPRASSKAGTRKAATIATRGRGDR